MSSTHRLATLVCGRRTKWVVLVFWLVIIGVSGPLAGKLMGAEKNDAKNWLPASAESTKAIDLQSAFQSIDQAPALIVYERLSGLTEADRAKVAADAKAFAAVPHVAPPVLGPLPDTRTQGQALEVVAQVNFGSGGWDDLATAVETMRDIATANTDGLTVHITGPGGYAADSAAAFKGIDGILLISAGVVVIVILLFTYRSPVLWLLPLLSAGSALFSAEALIYLLAKHAGLTVNAQSAGILVVLVFGAGTDYALLLIARYREELRRHEDRHEAMALALHRAGPAIVASASTVALGMICLLVAEMNSTKGLGPVLAIGIAVALLAMLTLLPALLVIVGRWMFWPRRPTFGSVEPTEHGGWARVGTRVARRPRAVWVVTALILGGIAVGLTSMHTGTLSNKDSYIGTHDSVTGEEVLNRHFDSDSGAPVVVISRADQADAVQSAFAGTAGIAPNSVQPAAADKGTLKNGFAYLEGTLTDAPDSPAAAATINRVRAAVHAVPGADAKVGGQTAIALDIQRAAEHDNKVIIPLVLGVVVIILMLLLRAVLAPLILAATVVLSFAAALGASVLIFKHVFGFAGEDSAFPLFVFVFLVALGIDYNIFLMTRVREESLRHGTRRGALVGLAATGGVITSAGLVLAGTFGVLATLPLVGFAEIGFAVALGVLLDTLVVRSVLVTALNLDIGGRIWWPSQLAKKPDVDVESTAQDEAALVT
ncbi:MAG TPA: MMPL family transporter [Mycobacteriales bacterium]|nr:MMPL family transporter [Mycobacteriales bacterium]